MPPVKFGLFKARSRDHQEQPSTENLLQSTKSIDQVATPSSPIPSTSKGIFEDQAYANVSMLSLDSEDDLDSLNIPQSRRVSECSTQDETQVIYHPLMNPPSTAATSTSTLQDLDLDQISEDVTIPISDNASTSCDVISIEVDESSIAPSEDVSIRCGALKKQKKNKLRKEQLLRDHNMWKASNYKVMQHLLSGDCTPDERIKWEVIATARGLCTLTDSCTCRDCLEDKYIAEIFDPGSSSIVTGPLLNAIDFGCQLQ